MQFTRPFPSLAEVGLACETNTIMQEAFRFAHDVWDMHTRHSYTMYFTLFQPTPHEHHQPNESFYDYPYTEWLSQRWTYHNQPFSNWPALPSYVGSIRQIAHGCVGGEEGLWLLDDSALYFALNLDGGDPASVKFLNISDSLGIEVEEGSQIAVADEGSGVYVITPANISFLDCSRER